MCSSLIDWCIYLTTEGKKNKKQTNKSQNADQSRDEQIWCWLGKASLDVAANRSGTDPYPKQVFTSFRSFWHLTQIIYRSNNLDKGFRQSDDDNKEILRDELNGCRAFQRFSPDKSWTFVQLWAAPLQMKSKVAEQGSHLTQSCL